MNLLSPGRIHIFVSSQHIYATSHWLSLQCAVHVEMCEILERRIESTDTAAIVVVIMRVRPYPDICAYHTYVRMGTHTTTRRISVSFIVCVAVNRTYDKSQQRHCLQVIIFKLHSLFSSLSLSHSLYLLSVMVGWCVASWIKIKLNRTILYYNAFIGGWVCVCVCVWVSRCPDSRLGLSSHLPVP